MLKSRTGALLPLLGRPRAGTPSAGSTCSSPRSPRPLAAGSHHCSPRDHTVVGTPRVAWHMHRGMTYACSMAYATLRCICHATPGVPTTVWSRATTMTSRSEAWAIGATSRCCPLMACRHGGVLTGGGAPLCETSTRICSSAEQLSGTSASGSEMTHIPRSRVYNFGIKVCRGRYICIHI